LEAFAIRAGMALGNALLHADLDRLAVTDALTGTYNQRGFVDLGKREFDRARRYGHPLGLISFTVDRLTLINDTHGRAVGDQVLAELGARCRRLLRSSDIVARPGRDEFCILVVETDPAGTAIVADRLRSRLAAESIATDAGPVAITVSVGTAGFDGSNKDFSMLLSRAGEAMSEASRRAGNKVVAWNGA
jgi:diguanylate cyclase (GGDEF)-like protein